jgi:hypothetical protein
MLGNIKHTIYKLNFYRYRIKDTLSGRYVDKFDSIDGYYRVDPTIDGCEPFLLPLHVGKSHRRDRINGKHEHNVFKRLIEFSDGNTNFWEIGAWRGYFSLVLASRIKSVVSFEAREHPLSKLKQAAERNKLENVQTVQDLVKSLDPYLEEYGTPDLVLLDIEGWEFEVLNNSPTFLDAQPVIIVEVHEESGWSKGKVVNPRGNTETVAQPDLSPEGVKRLLRESGYKLERIQSRRETNYHLLATPPE